MFFLKAAGCQKIKKQSSCDFSVFEQTDEHKYRFLWTEIKLIKTLWLDHSGRLFTVFVFVLFFVSLSNSMKKQSLQTINTEQQVNEDNDNVNSIHQINEKIGEILKAVPFVTINHR